MARLIATIPTTRTRLVATLSALALVLTACSAAAGAPGPPSASSGVMLSRTVPASITELPLTDQHGHVTDLAALHGRTVMIVPFLTPLPGDVPLRHGKPGAGPARARPIGCRLEGGADGGQRRPRTRHPRPAGGLRTAERRELGAGHRVAGHAHRLRALLRVGTSRPFPEDDPPGIDWWTHQPLTYDVDHSDGYTLIDPSGVERFETGASPDYSGGLSPTLRHFLSPMGRARSPTLPSPVGPRAMALASLGWMLHEHIAPASS